MKRLRGTLIHSEVLAAMRSARTPIFVAMVASLAVVGMAVGVPSAGAGTANDGFEVEPQVVPFYHLVNKPGRVGSRDNAEVRFWYRPAAGDAAPPAHLHFHVRPGVGGEFAYHNSRFNPCPQSLEPGDKCVIIVSIDVKAAGHLTATLEIRNGNMLVDTVPLSADAREP
jgi:hypothetical protein